MDDDWQAAQHQDELAHLHEVLEALKRAEEAGTPPEVVAFLACECGAKNFYRPSKTH